MVEDLNLGSTHNPLEATHVVVGNISKRTLRLMVALCMTSNIVNRAWLRDSHERNIIMPCTHKYKRFSETEEFGNDKDKFQQFSVEETLQEGIKRRKEGGLLAGYKIFVCEGVAGNKAPNEEELKMMVKAAGGEWLERSNNNDRVTITTEDQSNVLLITSDPAVTGQTTNEKALAAAQNGATFFTISWLFDCMIHQKVSNTHEPGICSDLLCSILYGTP